jgi:hypothetical protein
MRKMAAVVTPDVPSDYPMPNTRTRILDRCQTEGPIIRPVYIVEITHTGSHGGKEEIVGVDVSAILKYVSQAELERYENKQFEIEAAAARDIRRVHAEELAQKRLERNTRVPEAGRESRMLSGLGLGSEASTRGRGSPRGRRGRGYGRGVVSTQRVGSCAELLAEDRRMEELRRSEEEAELQREIPESEEEEEDDEADVRAQVSPNMMRSAFVANSALPVSPVHRRLSTSLAHQGHPEVADIGEDTEEDTDTRGYDARSMSSAATQLRYEDQYGGEVIENSDEVVFNPPLDAEEQGEEQQQRKRRRTMSMSMSIVPDSQLSLAQRPLIPEDAFRQTPLFNDHSSALDSASQVEDDAIPEDAFCQTPLFQDRSSMIETPSESSGRSVPLPNPRSRYADSLSPEYFDPPVEDYDTIHVTPRAAAVDDAEEYVIEAIIDHHEHGGGTHYLVKWEGYEDSHDWLREEDLEGAADLLEEYKQKAKAKEEEEASRKPVRMMYDY